MRLLVLGGNGFVGAQICRAAIHKGHSVISVSRSGPPTQWESSLWAQKVQWKMGDALSLETYDAYLKDCSAVIHSIGVLFENDWNKYVSGTGAPGASYSAANRDTALVAMREVLRLGEPKTFVFVSAKFAAPMMHAYLQTKQEVEEQLITNLSPTFRPVIFRPGFIYHSSRYSSLPLAWFIHAGNRINEGLRRATNVYLPGYPALTSLDTLSEAVVEACVNPSINGIVDAADIKGIVH